MDASVGTLIRSVTRFYPTPTSRPCFYKESSVALDNRPTMTVSLIVTQVCAAIFLLVATVICGICPAWIGHYVASRRRRRACDNSHNCLQFPQDDDSQAQTSEVSQKILSFLMNFGGECFVCLLSPQSLTTVSLTCRRSPFRDVDPAHATGSERKL